jgi:hypothetical protein
VQFNLDLTEFSVDHRDQQYPQDMCKSAV